MNIRRLIFLVAFVLGVVSGPYALASARATVPPIDWNAIPFVLTGSIVGMIFVLGIQIGRRNPAPARLALRMFEAISILILGMGMTALGVSFLKDGLVPSGVFFAAFGIGSLAGCRLASALFRWRYKNMLQQAFSVGARRPCAR